MVRRDAVDRQRADAHLLEAARGAAERVALGTAPVLAVDPTDTVAAAPEAQPHGQAGREQRLDRLIGRGADERQRLDQDQVRRLVLEGAGQQADRVAPVGRVDVAVDAERDRDLIAAAGLLRGLRASRTPCARDVHPVHRAGRVPGGAELPSRSAVGRPQVSVVITSQPAST